VCCLVLLLLFVLVMGCGGQQVCACDEVSQVQGEQYVLASQVSPAELRCEVRVHPQLRHPIQPLSRHHCTRSQARRVRPTVVSKWAVPR